ncbi:hydroxyacid dehydrogenase [Actinacidiphila bryophytorum]|uniref:D-3-phosphoglycerate dehydrogenase n=1 Tax=Actinacidiphila bryophytorum TaxID=1436133 RepID=A0A9W4H3L1_9ACTN|nr:hydroxyacid dehydrogenase [Actinacidiphila bryophytorum]MBM9439838.1 hydroxyacid dehydrogenase [Actinacidiphila bryophytorum]MBN6544729.1 hydroxyacid dehydrogenase [Actinacidiphila bryophytorum]CAG7648136.1 D-3-phosphoglycerate dehydrogenase [Actinacidiphila bryophytorum]
MPNKPHALVAMSRQSFDAHFDRQRLDRLNALVTVGDPLWTDDLDTPAARTRLADVEVLLTSWGAPQLTPARLAAAPRLRAVLHCAGSVRGLVGDAVWRRGIRVTSGADANAIPVAEYTLAAIIFAGKKAPFLAADEQRAYGGWGSVTGYGDLSNYGRTVGVVGFSRIGRKVVGLLGLLGGTTCLVADPHADAEEVAAAGGTLVALDELLPRTDILTLHAPELAETRHLIGAAELSLLPDHATVINTARGSLIDDAALAAECAAGRLFAILDVTDPEPLPLDSPLRRLARVMVTPHIAGSLGTEIGRLTDHTLDELARWTAHQPLTAEITAEHWALGLSA